MTHHKLRRSVLYTPGANPTVLLKAARSRADVLIFDLEDAVAPERKADARLAVANTLPDPQLAGREVVVRVNAIGTPWCEQDLELLTPLSAVGILFPKINTVADCQRAAAMLDLYGAPPATELWCMIESPEAVINLRELSAVAREIPRLTTWVLGTNDLVKELRAQHTPERQGLVPLLAITVAAARAAGLCVLDGVHNDVKDVPGFAFTCQQGRQMGFDGRTLIHPSQIDACHAAYSPTEEEIAVAKTILQAFALPENQGKGVLQLGGRMVELLHAEIARETLSAAQAIERSNAKVPT